ncbi:MULTISPECIES: 8-oxo-dGTP diphosphatase MutT [Alteromonadaceae]|uniref:8-oxo-dGTP diphosphatase MutT n=1 Tax=Alteromonadaceae TaxID=72275 RepID=UPI001C09A22C|nr:MULTISPECIES: 8-oxo-dGTP diphosphatase MutT [Aliiglaciecola]MBU2876640.1 8-oxo-dGTP diphosphatase MutT [Aliiglaciecola lipolytica]MDO6711425.1 8-oxo-dGTP diphosphatase MutT [Aliiglaciecola sp. 2_MG-2023]MDO6752598.1 8-oxo-dGTP diphosphatase MutT [Aliiglaciecola sp. 1_MG-2023]
MKIVDVAVGVIKRDNLIFISKRADDLHQGGLWEFPGGKIEANETVAQATARELHEEVGIDVVSQSEFMLIEHDYGDKQVRLHIQLVEQFSNEPCGKEGQLTQWVAIDSLASLTFPAANQAIIAKLESDF